MLKRLLAFAQTPLENLSLDRRILNQLSLFEKRGWTVLLLLPHSSSEVLRTKFLCYSEIIAFPYPDQAVDLLGAYIGKYSTLPFIKTENLFSDRDLESSIESFKANNSQFNPYPLTGEFLKYAKHVSCDAVLACDYPTVLSALLLFHEKQIPFLFDSHEFCVGEGNHSDLMKRAIKQVELDSIKNAVVFYTISDFFADLYKYEYSLTSRPLYFCNAPNFDIKEYPTDKHWIHKKFSLSIDSKIIIFHGGLWPKNRNIERLVESFLELGTTQNRYLLFLGYGTLAEPISRIGNNILYHPSVSQQELPKWLYSSSACIIPYICVGINQRFCMPNKLFDCIDLELPLIVNENLENLTRISKEYGIGFYGPMETKEDMIATLVSAFEWLERAANFSQKNFAAAKSEYGWSTQCQNFDRIIDRLESRLADYDLSSPLINDSDISKVAENLVEWGDRYQAEDQTTRAIVEYRKALEVEPGYIDAIQKLTNLYRHQGQLREGYNLICQGLNHRPQSPELYQLLGEIFYELARLQQALRAYWLALQIESGLAHAHWRISQILHQQGDLEKAIKSQEIALDLDPGLVQTSTYLERANLLAQRGNIDEALRDCQRAAQVAPNSAQAHFQCGNLYWQQGKLQDAIQSWKTTVNLVPLGIAHWNLYHALVRLGNYEEAEGHYLMALELKPDLVSAEHHVQVGDHLMQKSRTGEAIGCYTRALSLRADFPEAMAKLDTALRSHLLAPIEED